MKTRKCLRKIIIYQLIIDTAMSVLSYFLVPILMNYADWSVEYNFVEEYAGISYFSQAIFMYIPYIIMPIIFILIYLRSLWLKDCMNADEIKKERIGEKLQRTPYIVYAIKIIWLPIMVASILFMSKTPLLVTFKLTLVLSAFFLLDAAIVLVLIKNLFNEMLIKIGLTYLVGRKISIKKSMFLQIVSMLIASFTFISILGYSRILEEVGASIYDRIDLLLDQYFEETPLQSSINDELIGLKYFLGEEEYTYFAIDSNGKVFTLDDKELGEYPLIHTKKMIELKDELHDNRIFDVSKEYQGVIKEVRMSDGEYIFGVFYSVIPTTTVKYFFYSIFSLIILNIIVVLYYSSNMSKSITEVTSTMESVVSGSKVDYDKKLPVTSNDEIGELVIAFNKILDLEKNNIETMSRNQEILVEQERLSSLGQLIGGIAHNLKTPIMSISGALEGVEDLIKEYDESIDDSQVTKEDHHQIAGEMKEWISKIRPYLSYMTEVIDAVKGQAVSMNASTVGEFSAEELIARTQILMKNELKRRHCNLNLDLNISEKTQIKGEISAIVQVMDNLIINAMDAYGEKGGNIDIKVREDEDTVYIEVADLAGGIADSVKDKLFKEMITSKGKNGTGLGLYMCYSTIKGKFDGDMWFESKEGVGTTFHITLNKLKN